MEFFIRQGATDPILKMRMIDDGKNDKSSFNDMLASGATITFEMSDVTTGEPMVLEQINWQHQLMVILGQQRQMVIQ